MTDRALPSAWLDQALAAAAPATELELARHLWRSHEAELREAGDLLLIWQLLLRDDLAERERSGTVRREGERWVPVAAGDASPVVDPRTPWTPEQVAPAVEAYVDLLRAEHDGRVLRRPTALAHAVEATGRPAEQVERIWSNVSHVLQEHGIEPLLSCPPRSNVPAGVRPAVQRLLDVPG